MVDTETYPCYILIGDEDDLDECMELPSEKDGSILLSTIQAQFPCAIGLKYKSATGLMRGVRVYDNILRPPFEGWGNNHYIITLPKQGKCYFPNDFYFCFLLDREKLLQ